MRGLIVASAKPNSGKTIICAGLAMKFMEIGLRVGYFKPVSLTVRFEQSELIDEDVTLMRELLGLKEPPSVLNPVTLHDFYFEEVMRADKNHADKIKSAFEVNSKNKDVVIVEYAPSLEVGAIFGISIIEVAREFNLPVLLASRADADSCYDELLMYREIFRQFNIDLIGAILNGVPRHLIERVHGIIVPALMRKGLAVYGVLPAYSPLHSPTVGDILSALRGEVLAGKNGLSNLVENVLVGAMTPENALQYFRRAPNKLVITGGDRADVVLAALETSTSGIVLTGNIYPSVRVLNKAEERKVPVILVPYDTYTTARIVDKITGKIKAGDKRRIEHIKALINKHVDWRGILKRLSRDISKMTY